jgi:hypothetical protein
MSQMYQNMSDLLQLIYTIAKRNGSISKKTIRISIWNFGSI